ncbi:MAG TPA: Flp family type IVb pilin [Stellaceae bacterium]|nr:Flp family type IVb pilin [Stellaceae bacterium]
MNINSIFKHVRAVSYGLHEGNRGATAIEYALLAMLIALAIVAGVSSIAPKLNTTFTTVSGDL